MVCLAGVSAAHETWLLPASMRIRSGETVELSLTSGMAFPADDFAIQPSRVIRAEARLGKRIEQLKKPKLRPLALQYLWTPRANGVATIGIELGPRTLTLEPNLIEEYFQEIHASDVVRAQWDSIPSPKQWRESYVKHASSFIRVGPPGNDRSWASPLGLGLEIIPENNPTTLSAGDTLHVRVMRRGLEIAGFAVGARREGDSTETFVNTDGDGRAAIGLPKEGRWLLFGTDLRPARQRGLEWRSDFVTTTVGVGSPSR